MGLTYTITHNGYSYGPVHTGNSIYRANGSYRSDIGAAGNYVLHSSGLYAPSDITIGEKILHTSGKIITSNIGINVTTNPFGPGGEDKTISSNETWWASGDNGVIERSYHNFTINSGVTISAGGWNSGIIIRCTGDCIINGTLANRFSPRTWSSSLGDPATVLAPYYPTQLLTLGSGVCAGGKGYGVGAGTTGSGIQHAAAMGGRIYGGGWGSGGSGGEYYRSWSSGPQTGEERSYGYNGGATDTITTDTPATELWTCPRDKYRTYGRYGGGGDGHLGSYSTTSDYIDKGRGGTGAGGSGTSVDTPKGRWNYTWIGDLYYGCGGGAGNYGGGVVIIYCGGRMILNGSIDCRGQNGGNGGSGILRQTYDPVGDFWQGNSGGGGGGGGGRIYISYANTNSSIPTGQLLVSGGSGGLRHVTTTSGYDSWDKNGFDGANGDYYVVHYTG